MSGPQGYDPNQAWSSGQQQPPASEEPTAADITWQQPAYTPPQYSPTEQYPTTTPQYQPTQYGQPGQYGQPTQYGQTPTQYGQPGQYQPGPVAETDAAKGSRSSLAVLGAIIGVLAAIIVAVVLVMGFWKPGFFVTTKLDVNKAQAGVQQILTDQVNGYGVKNVKDVKCNNGENPTVKKGDSFTCDASVDGQHKQVTVTFQDDNGTYEVGRPK